MTKQRRHQMWGVMFHDGSVRAQWNGHTEEQRAREAAEALKNEYSPDRITLAHWNGEHWERVSGTAEHSWNDEGLCVTHNQWCERWTNGVGGQWVG